MPTPRSWCTFTFTIWDDDWDPFLRRILVSFSPLRSGHEGERDRDRLAEALNAANCRTIQAAKSLDSSALGNVPQEIRESFLKAIADADVLGKVVFTSSECTIAVTCTLLLFEVGQRPI
jgi:hypothetical protein